ATQSASKARRVLLNVLFVIRLPHRSQTQAEVRRRRVIRISFDFRPSPFALRPSPFDSRLSTLDLRPSTFDSRPSTFDLRLSALPQVPPRMYVVPNIGTVGIERAVGTVSEPIGIVIISRLVLSEHHFPKSRMEISINGVECRLFRRVGAG